MPTPTLFILSWERPIFLWATLDSIYRNTQRDLNIVLIDNGSQNSDVHDVIDGFSRRDMFAKVHRYEDNRPDRMRLVVRQNREHLDSHFFFCENDVVVPNSVCWATEYEKIRKKIPDTGMIGSFCDKSDFIDPELIRKKEPELSDEQIQFYSKSESPERCVALTNDIDVWPHEAPNPPGRLILISTEAIDHVGIHPDSILASKMIEKGFRAVICTTFTHRHLSLMNWFDVKNRTYAQARTSFFAEMSQEDDCEKGNEKAVDLLKEEIGGLVNALPTLEDKIQALRSTTNILQAEILERIRILDESRGLFDLRKALRLRRARRIIRNKDLSQEELMVEKSRLFDSE